MGAVSADFANDGWTTCASPVMARTICIETITMDILGRHRDGRGRRSTVVDRRGAGDYDGDGRLDLFVITTSTSGSTLPEFGRPVL
jgi:hypothetical protein